MQISPELWKAYEAATVEVHLSGKNFVFPPGWGPRGEHG